MAEGVDDLLRGQDMVRGHNVVDQRLPGCLLSAQPGDQRGRAGEQESTAWEDVHAC